jgi:hypothetical protein
MRRGWDVPRRCLQRALSSMGVSSEQELCLKVRPAPSLTCPWPEEKHGETKKEGGPGHWRERRTSRQRVLQWRALAERRALEEGRRHSMGYEPENSCQCWQNQHGADKLVVLPLKTEEAEEGERS